MQNDGTREQRKAGLIAIVSLCKELLVLAREQRAAVRERNWTRLEGATAALSLKYQELLFLQRNSLPVEDETPAFSDLELGELTGQARGLAEELRIINQGNLLLIKASMDAVRPLLDTLETPSFSSYGEEGIKSADCRAIAIDRMV